ncbi:MAG: DUF3394 domain-containing protein, partial [Leisingera sp.]
SESGLVRLEEPVFGTRFSEVMQGFDFYADEPVALVSVSVPADQMPKELIYLPAFVLLGLIALLQRRRLVNGSG